MSAADACVLFTKPARPGQVKTRLIGALTAAEAAELQQAFLDDLVSRLASRDFDLLLAWALEGDEPIPQAPVTGFRQVGRDLGERLLHGLRYAAERHARVAAVGSDHPEIPVAAVEDAFGRLDDCDVVIGPALDGGYYLIALAADSLDPRLFSGIDWSTPEVLEQTLERCAAIGAEVSLLPEGADVDAPADLERLKRFLADERHDCRQTERLLREWGML